MLLALLLPRFIFKHSYPSIWWSLLKDGRCGLPSYPQAHVRGTHLFAQLEAIATPARPCAEVVIDSMPLPICRPKRGKRCAFPEATWGFGTQGQVFGYKLHAWRRGVPSRWISPTGNIFHYLVRPANFHDAAIGHELLGRQLRLGEWRRMSHEAEIRRAVKR